MGYVVKNRKFAARGAGLALAGLMAVSFSGGVAAQSGGPSTEQLLKLIQQQQRQLDQMKAALQRAQSSAEQAAAKADAAPKTTLSSYITIGGLVEIEATEAEAFDKTNSSDVTVSKVELSVDAKPNDWLLAHSLLLYEDDGTETIEIDEAYAMLGNTEKFPLYVQAGKWPMPFGNFDTDMSADPLTLELGETKEKAVMVGAVLGGLSAHAYVYNGDTRQSAASDHIDQFGVAVDYEAEFNGASFSVGASYINNLADSDNLTTALGGSSTGLSNYVPGFEAHGAFKLAGFTLRGGYMTATRAFQAGELAFAGRGAEPAAWHTEIAYTTPILKRDVTFALTAQGTEEALALGLPERRIGGAVTVAVIEHASVTLEYLNDDDYSAGDGGTGATGHTGTVKLAVEF